MKLREFFKIVLLLAAMALTGCGAVDPNLLQFGAILLMGMGGFVLLCIVIGIIGTVCDEIFGTHFTEENKKGESTEIRIRYHRSPETPASRTPVEIIRVATNALSEQQRPRIINVHGPRLNSQSRYPAIRGNRCPVRTEEEDNGE